MGHFTIDDVKALKKEDQKLFIIVTGADNIETVSQLIEDYKRVEVVGEVKAIKIVNRNRHLIKIPEGMNAPMAVE
ncbi:hypothetical protein ACQKMI_14140 [Lysinibacillus sp. NPDC097214]|uniref:hypothetical protein n=1 Tax=Lysinibacillus sp. NPDC097214 TaxID=3390584 RepID=UPI003CFC78EE